MKGMREIREMLCEVAAETARKGDLSPGAIDLTDKVLNSIKNTYKIEMFEKQEGGYSRDGSYDSYGMDSYKRGYSRGSYAEDSYRRGSSRHGEDFKMKLREMMDDARDEKEREVYRRVMTELED